MDSGRFLLMSGYQFAHLEVWARKPREVATNKKGERRTPKKQWGVQQVLDEAERKEGNCPHVEKPLTPQVVYGCSMDELREQHDQVDGALCTLSNGKTRKIRNTQSTMASCVFSYPVSMNEIRKDKKEQERYYEWRKRTIDFIIGEWGDNLKNVVQHLDESHPHIHCHALANDWDATKLHPGLMAAKGLKGKEASLAYCEAMRDFQNRYQEQVGRFCGQTRLGPGRRRLTRDQWKAEQAQQMMLQSVLEQSEGIRSEYKEQATREALSEFSEVSAWGKIGLARANARKTDIEDAIQKGREEIQPSLDAITSEKNSLKKKVSKLSSDLKQSQKDLYEKTAPDREAKKREEFYQMMVERLVDHDIDMGVNPIDKLKEIQRMEDIPKTLSDFVNAIIEMIAQSLGIPLPEQSHSYKLGR
jgi:hypothetical protein